MCCAVVSSSILLVRHFMDVVKVASCQRSMSWLIAWFDALLWFCLFLLHQRKGLEMATSQRVKVMFDDCPGTSARHYLLVAKEGERFGELCAKILSDCKHLKLDHSRELASLSWKGKLLCRVLQISEFQSKVYIDLLVHDCARLCMTVQFGKEFAKMTFRTV